MTTTAAEASQVYPAVSPSTMSAFLDALNGKRGDLDAWLEFNNEAEVREHVLALVKYEREKCAKICDMAAEMAWSRWDLLALQFDQGGAFEAEKIADEIRKA